MKRFKRIIVNIMALLLVVVSCAGLTACNKDIRTMTLTISVYNYDEDAPKFETVKLTVDLYGHLAHKTVDTIQKYVNSGYYNDAVFYELATTGNSFKGQVMLGDVLDVDGVLELNAVKPEIDGEFERGGVTGSNLKAKKGSIGLYRSWYEGNNEGYAVSNAAMHSGRATWFVPTSDSGLSSYEEWFCVFAQINLNNSKNAKALELITQAVEEYTVDYVIYYTGTYDETKADENYGLTAHIVEQELFEMYEDDAFVAEGAQLVCYNAQTVKIPVVDGNLSDGVAVKIVSAKVK